MEVAVKDRIVLTPNTIWLEKLFLNYLPLTNATFKVDVQYIDKFI